MDKIKDFFQNPIVGVVTPVSSAAIAEFCNNLIPVMTFISLGIGILVGITSLYLNIKKSRKS